MSIQIAISKKYWPVTSAEEPHSTHWKHDLAILASSGDDWHARIKRLASRVPELDIFGNGYLLRDVDGWEITSAGRAFLVALEAVTHGQSAARAIGRDSASSPRAR